MDSKYPELKRIFRRNFERNFELSGPVGFVMEKVCGGKQQYWN